MDEQPVGRLVALARERHPDDPLLAEFLPPYFAELPAADVDDRRLDDVLAMAAAHLRLGAVRAPGRTLARVADAPDAPDLDGGRGRSVLLVVTDDAPFLVDTIRLVLERRAVGLHLLVHPMLDVARDRDDRLRAVAAVGGLGAEVTATEAWTQVEIDRCADGAAGPIEREVVAAIERVHAVVRDFPAMRERTAALATADPLLGWLAAEHLVFLGAVECDRDGAGRLRARGGTGLGVLREPDAPTSWRDPFDAADGRVVVSRSEEVATIHRAARITQVDVLAGDGTVHHLVGLLASSVYRTSVLDIPSIGERAQRVLALSGAPADSHTTRSMRSVLETLPRDLVLELDADALATLVIDIVGLQERQVVRVFEVPEPHGSWSTVLVYLPRRRFDARVPELVERAVGAAAGAPTRDVESLLGTSSLARITVSVRRGIDDPRLDCDALAARIDELTRTWGERVEAALAPVEGVDRRTLARIADAAPADYRAVEGTDGVVADVQVIAGLLEQPAGAMTTALRHDPEAPADEWRFRVYRRDRPTALAEVLPLLDHLGLVALDERPFEFDLGEQQVYLYDIGVRMPAALERASERHAEVLATFEALVRGEVEDDRLNRLVALAGLTGREVAVLRAYAKYLRQIGFAFSQAYVEDAFARLPEVARRLLALFTARFDPTLLADPVARQVAVDVAQEQLVAAVDEISVLDDDRICRAFMALVDATVRTNAFRGRDAVAFKLDPARVPDLPAPRPVHEIWVCSPRVEGVHLRAGAIARGGLRWSDRREDFRTEVLGLVKAQMVKNSVIVPVGAKGGFVVKQPPADPGALREEVVACYRTFVGSMLDLTDNVVDGRVVHPPDTVVLDGDDPYLVVAADKGTATFSDVANAVAAEYGFWLGDAFASGGSVGYDHKAMGITARGAWESVRRHGRILGLDVDRDPITVVGIGDMSGDVFGNGLLRSPHVRLVAAFDHRHVFVDPNPDPTASYAERARLFALPRSSWADYDTRLLSPGGAVYSRSAKSLTLSPEACAALGITTPQLTPVELVRAVLMAPVDLLWNGGIGTYVKASTERDADVGDRTNDAVRVDGDQLRCRMVGEGGNLGLTQRGRVEYALHGGLVNTDAIDNSAGVDCSDHEVNIKILLDRVVARGALAVPERNELLASMTDEVAELVLDHNRSQSLALVIARRQALGMVNVHARYLDVLEAEGWLDRELEDLPSDKQIAERQAGGQGLQVPEFAVMMAYTKNADVTEVLRSDLPDDPALEPDLLAYFPSVLRERYPDDIRAHRLRREIVTTRLVDQMVNLSGISYDHRMTEDTGAGVVDVLRAWVAARDVVGLTTWWARIDALAGEVPLDVQLDLFLDCRRMNERASLWLLRHRRPPLDIAAAVDRFRPGIEQLASSMRDVLTGRLADVVDSTEASRIAVRVPGDLAERAGAWPLLHTGFDMVEVAELHHRPVLDVARTYWQVFDRLDLLWLWEGIGALPRSDRWQTQARSAVRDDLLTALAELASTVFATADGSVDRWLAANERAVARAMALVTEVRRAERHDLTTLSVALRQLRNLALTSTGSVPVP